LKLPRFSRDDLVAYLRPFAQEGKVVNENDVKEFFEKLREGRRVAEN
jgi:E3 ubiquitin-protein ligase UBR7